MFAFVDPNIPSKESSVGWTDICALDDLPQGAGVSALLEGEQIALLRSRDGKTVYAISNFDPFSKAFVLARGIIGDRAGVPKVSSPMYKQSFDLLSGQCLDDPQVRLAIYPVAVVQGRVFVGRGIGGASG